MGCMPRYNCEIDDKMWTVQSASYQTLNVLVQRILGHVAKSPILRLQTLASTFLPASVRI